MFPRMALGATLLAPLVLTVVDLGPVSLSPAEVQSGGASTGTVTLDPAPATSIRVNLSSSTPAVATVPASVMVGTTGRATFSAQSVHGAAGCPAISAQFKATTKSALLYVHPPAIPSPVSLTLSKTSVAGGASLTGRVVVSQPSAIGSVVRLSSSLPSVTVPATVTLNPNEMNVGEATFTIGTAVVAPSTCAIITATWQARSTRLLLKVNSISG